MMNKKNMILFNTELNSYIETCINEIGNNHKDINGLVDLDLDEFIKSLCIVRNDKTHLSHTFTTSKIVV